MTRKAFPVRGLMLDPARLTERHEFYFDLLPQLAAWGYNTLWWHFCDDEGCALKLESHPEFASPYAFSTGEMRKLIQAAADCGITIVPEVESLGHALFITSLPRYSRLFNGNPYGHNALCPSHPETVPLIEEIITEVARLFPGRYLHAGLDEAEIGNCLRCARRARGKPAWWLFVEHILRVHAIAARTGKRMIMWADGVEKHPALLRKLPKDIVLAHWHYRDVPAEKIRPSVAAGFQVVLVPAIGGPILQPDAKVFDNVNQMVALAAALPSQGSLGVVASWWESNRNLRDTYPLAAAHAGHAMNRRRAVDPVRFTRRFVRSYFGLNRREDADALYRAHTLTLGRGEIKSLYPDHLADIQNALVWTKGRELERCAAEAERCVRILQAACKRARHHREACQASRLAARITATGHRNAVRLRDAQFRLFEATVFAEAKMPRARVLQSLRLSFSHLHEMARDVSRLAGAATREWDRTRHAGDEKKDGSSLRQRQRGSRAILATLLHSARFLRRLVRDYQRAIATYRRGGPLPGGF